MDGGPVADVIRERHWTVQRNCGHFRTAHARFDVKGGGTQIRLTCLDCGKRVGSSEARSAHPNAADYPTVIKADPSEQGAATIDPVVDYQAYLASPEWAQRRAYYVARALARCELCGWESAAGSDGRGLNVHHRTYERIGREFDADVIVLCRDCHKKFHGIVEEAA